MKKSVSKPPKVKAKKKVEVEADPSEELPGEAVSPEMTADLQRWSRKTGWAKEPGFTVQVARDAKSSRTPTPHYNASEYPLRSSCAKYGEEWRALEQAKRRLIHGLDYLGVPHGSTADGFDPGLSFDFKEDSVAPQSLWRSVGPDERVFTGHAGGKITINIREADTVEREKLRVDLSEGHRTLIGHFRHEIGHYYWDLLVAGDAGNEARFRALFGDHENPTYAEALDRYYAEGPAPDWQAAHISAYATMHPWEDWAETFSFYLDVVDVMETASSSGLIAVQMQGDLKTLVETYSRLGILLNELNRAMGLIDFLPGVVTPAVFDKLQLVHDVIAGASPEHPPSAGA